MELISAIAVLLGMVLCFLIWILPVLLIAASSRTHGAEKLAWILAVIFVSWFAWIFYLLLAPLKERERYRDAWREYRY